MMNGGKKVLAVAASLALCVGMVSPAFAASFDDLQWAISGYNDGPDNLIDSGRYGYGENVETGGWDIVASTDEGTRNVTLNADVTYDGSKDSNASIGISSSANVNLDLNGNTITGSGKDPVFVVDPEGLPTAGMPTPPPPGELTLTNTNDKKEGSITGGSVGVYVKEGATLTVEENVEFSKNESSDVHLEAGANLTGGQWKKAGAEDGEILKGEDTITADSPVDLAFYQGPVTTDPEPTDPKPTDPEPSEKEPDTEEPGEEVPDEETDEALTAPIQISIIDIPQTSDTMSGAELFNYLWIHEGEPEPESGVEADESDGKYAAAVAWSRSIGLLGDVDGVEIDLDEPITVTMMRTILVRFCAWKGMEMPELAKLTGEDDAIVPNCREILKEFFGED